jgi:thioredoxin 2
VTTKQTRCPTCTAINRVPVVATGRLRCGKCRTSLPWLVDVATDQFDAVIGQSSVPVLVDLWAPWCGPCRAIAPALEHLAAERAGSLRVAKVNVDEEPAVSAQLGVQGIPTMVLYQAGVEVGRQVGALPADRIRQWVDATLATTR